MSRELNYSVGSRCIGNYVLGKNLGEGTFGKVKLGTHCLTGEKVAVKILEKSKIVTAADVQRVSRQIQILKTVRHPHIIQLYEIIETQKQLLLVMEYVSDGELFQYIVKRRKLKQSEACQFFRQIIAGVEYLHTVGIVHRDLKPQNLLIDFDRRLKLVDFGLSNMYKQKQLLKTACGSPCYASPEMISGKKYVPLGSDIWSCGIILFAMICGYLPFEDPNTPALYKKITSGEFNIPKFVSPSARELLIGILNVNPENRFTLKDIKAHPWFKQLGEESPTHSNGLIVGQHRIPVDDDIINGMKQYIKDTQDVKKYVKLNKHNHQTTIYYLLTKKNFRMGVHSLYDICSHNFDRKLIQISTKQLASDNTIQSLQMQHNQPGSRAASRSQYNRITNYSQNNYLFNKKKNDSLELKLDLDNLPQVETSQKKKRLNVQINIKNTTSREKDNSITSPKGYSIDTKRNPQTMRNTLYDIQEFMHLTPYGRKSLRPPTNHKNPNLWRQQINKSQQKDRDIKLEEKWERYQSLDVNQQKKGKESKELMMRTFMGSVPKGYIPRFQDQSQRIRGILNTTISGHSKKRNSKKLWVF